MKGIGYGKDYKYPHSYPGHFVKEIYLPDSLKGKSFYHPGNLGYEKQIAERLRLWWPERMERKEKNEGRA
jgi:putative ATPase